MTILQPQKTIIGDGERHSGEFSKILVKFSKTLVRFCWRLGHFGQIMLEVPITFKTPHLITYIFDEKNSDQVLVSRTKMNFT